MSKNQASGRGKFRRATARQQLRALASGEREGRRERERDGWGKNGEMAERRNGGTAEGKFWRNGGRKVLAAGDEELADGED